MRDDPARYSTPGDRMTETAAGWIGVNDRQPFFFWVHYFDPHIYNAPTTPPEVRAKYPGLVVRNRTMWDTIYKHANPQMKARYQDFCRAMYTEEVKYVDGCVAQFLEALRAAGLWDNSLIVITADHGEEMFEHGDWEHGHSMHREVIQVPLLVKWPQGVSADRQVPQVVGLTNLGATLLEMAGLPIGEGETAPSLPRRAAEKGYDVYSEGMLHVEEQTALTTDRWRIIYRPYSKPPLPTWAVYDRRKDPLEKVNLAESDAAREERARLLHLTEESTRRVAAWAKRRQGKERPVLTKEAEQQLKSLGYMK
jgi:arylsulfatase A-like enzyme